MLLLLLYIYIYRERERDRYDYNYNYIYITLSYVYTSVPRKSVSDLRRAVCAPCSGTHNSDKLFREGRMDASAAWRDTADFPTVPRVIIVPACELLFIKELCIFEELLLFKSYSRIVQELVYILKELLVSKSYY